MNISSNHPNKFTELDFIRAIAVIAVVAIHVTSITLTKSSPNEFTLMFCMIVNQLSRFCVPAFLFVSGILAFHSLKRNSYVTLLRGKINQLIIPYVVWTLFGLLFFLTYTINSKGIVMIFLTGNGPFYQLYYIPVLIQLFVILPFIMKPRLSKIIMITLSGLTVFLFAGYQFVLMAKVLPNDLVTTASVLMQSTFVVWMAYFYIGLYMAQNYAKFLEYIKSKSTTMFVVLSVMSAIALVTDAYIGFVTQKQTESMNYFRITVFLYSISTIALLMKLGMSFQIKALTSLYRNSFGIYLVHVGIIKIVFLFSSVFFSNILFIVISSVLTIIASYWIVELIKRTPLSFLLLGQPYLNKHPKNILINKKKEIL